MAGASPGNYKRMVEDSKSVERRASVGVVESAFAIAKDGKLKSLVELRRLLKEMG